MSSPFRMGLVKQCDAATCRVRVEFGADDALLSYWLPVMQRATHQDKAYAMPGVGEHVVCLLDEHAEFGVVLGAIYSDVDTPPVASLDRVHIAFGDGTTIDYDRAAHALSVTIASGGAVTVAADQVLLGGAAGDQLVTKSWADTVFALHTHGHPLGQTFPPAGGAQTSGGNVTQKVRAE